MLSLCMCIGFASIPSQFRFVPIFFSTPRIFRWIFFATTERERDRERDEEIGKNASSKSNEFNSFCVFHRSFIRALVTESRFQTLNSTSNTFVRAHTHTHTITNKYIYNHYSCFKNNLSNVTTSLVHDFILMAPLQRIRDMFVSEWNTCSNGVVSEAIWKEQEWAEQLLPHWIYARASIFFPLMTVDMFRLIFFSLSTNRRSHCAYAPQHMYFRSMIPLFLFLARSLVLDARCVRDMVISSNSFACFLIDCFQPTDGDGSEYTNDYSISMHSL